MGGDGERFPGLRRIGGWRYRGTALVPCLAAFFATAFARLVVSPAVPAPTDALDLVLRSADVRRPGRDAPQKWLNLSGR